MTDTNDYRIENLGHTFGKHAEMADQLHEDDVARYLANYPDSPMPEHFKNSFNISRALSVMACEIEKLKHLVGIKEIN